MTEQTNNQTVKSDNNYLFNFEEFAAQVREEVRQIDEAYQLKKQAQDNNK